MEPASGPSRPAEDGGVREAGTVTGPEVDPVTGVQVDEDRHAIGFGSAEVSLTPLEFALLRLLMAEPGRVWRFDELVRRVWGTDHLGDASQVHAVVKRLRAKLAREHAPVAIEAVRGVGFRAVAPAGSVSTPTG
jgi:two-component system response regulator MtrA